MIYTGFTPHTKQRDMIQGIIESPAKYHVGVVDGGTKESGNNLVEHIKKYSKSVYRFRS